MSTTRHRRRRSRLSKRQVGLIAGVLIAVLAVGCYTKFANPFANPFRVEVTFANANGLLPGSPVRVAGVQVGTVSGVSRVGGADSANSPAAAVSLQLDAGAPAFHDDATFQIRPRIFLEGNFFVDAHPGTPNAPVASSGHIFGLGAGTEPVQIDQLLTSLQAGTRASLQTLIQQYGEAVKLGGPAYNASIPYWLPAYKYSSIVSHDFLGTAPNDLEHYIVAGATVSAATDASPSHLESLIDHLDATAAAFSSQRAALAAAVQELPVALSDATPAFLNLDAALPRLDRLSVALIPGVRSSGPASVASLPFVRQTRYLVRPAELQGFARVLAADVPSLARLTRENIPLLARQVRPASACIVNEIYPWSQLSINDGNMNTTPGEPVRKVYIEAVDYLPGLAGESRVFDANGPYIRTIETGGSLTYSLSPGMFGTALSPLTSVQPQLPAGGQRPPLHPGIHCDTQSAITQAGIQAPTGGAISPTPTSLSAPGATLRWADANVAAIAQIERIAHAQGVPVSLSTGLTDSLRRLLGSGLAGVPGAATTVQRTLASIGVKR